MLSGVNKRCQQCIKGCKQWEEVKLIFCSVFVSKQQGSPKESDGKKKGG